MEDLILRLMTEYGYFAIFFLIFVENLFPPIPSEVILLFGGFMSLKAGLDVKFVILAATLGSLLGAEVLYYIGKKLGYKGVKRFFTGKIGQTLGLTQGDLSRTNLWFHKRGNWAVFLCRFVPLMRSLISIPAGIANMDKKIFIILTAVGSLIWNSVITIAGMYAGESWHKYNDIISKFSDVIVYIGGTLVLLFIGYKLYKRHKAGPKTEENDISAINSKMEETVEQPLKDNNQTL